MSSASARATSSRRALRSDDSNRASATYAAELSAASGRLQPQSAALLILAHLDRLVTPHLPPLRYMPSREIGAMESEELDLVGSSLLHQPWCIEATAPSLQLLLDLLRYAAAPNPVSADSLPTSQQPIVRPFCVVACLRLVRANLVAVVCHAAATKKRRLADPAEAEKMSTAASAASSEEELSPSSETIRAVHLELTRLVRRPPEFHGQAGGSSAVAEEAARGLVVGLSLFYPAREAQLALLSGLCAAAAATMAAAAAGTLTARKTRAHRAVKVLLQPLMIRLAGDHDLLDRFVPSHLSDRKTAALLTRLLHTLVTFIARSSSSDSARFALAAGVLPSASGALPHSSAAKDSALCVQSAVRLLLALQVRLLSWTISHAEAAPTQPTRQQEEQQEPAWWTAFEKIGCISGGASGGGGDGGGDGGSGGGAAVAVAAEEGDDRRATLHFECVVAYTKMVCEQCVSSLVVQLAELDAALAAAPGDVSRATISRLLWPFQAHKYLLLGAVLPPLVTSLLALSRHTLVASQLLPAVELLLRLLDRLSCCCECIRKRFARVQSSAARAGAEAPEQKQADTMDGLDGDEFGGFGDEEQPHARLIAWIDPLQRVFAILVGRCAASLVAGRSCGAVIADKMRRSGKLLATPLFAGGLRDVVVAACRSSCGDLDTTPARSSIATAAQSAGVGAEPLPLPSKQQRVDFCLALVNTESNGAAAAATASRRLTNRLREVFTKRHLWYKMLMRQRRSGPGSEGVVLDQVECALFAALLRHTGADVQAVAWARHVDESVKRPMPLSLQRVWEMVGRYRRRIISERSTLERDRGKEFAVVAVAQLCVQAKRRAQLLLGFAPAPLHGMCTGTRVASRCSVAARRRWRILRICVRAIGQFRCALSLPRHKGSAHASFQHYSEWGGRVVEFIHPLAPADASVACADPADVEALLYAAVCNCIRAEQRCVGMSAFEGVLAGVGSVALQADALESLHPALAHLRGHPLAEIGGCSTILRHRAAMSTRALFRATVSAMRDSIAGASAATPSPAEILQSERLLTTLMQAWGALEHTELDRAIDLRFVAGSGVIEVLGACVEPSTRVRVAGNSAEPHNHLSSAVSDEVRASAWSLLQLLAMQLCRMRPELAGADGSVLLLTPTLDVLYRITARLVSLMDGAKHASAVVPQQPQREQATSSSNGVRVVHEAVTLHRHHEGFSSKILSAFAPPHASAREHSHWSFGMWIMCPTELPLPSDGGLLLRYTTLPELSANTSAPPCERAHLHLVTVVLDSERHVQVSLKHGEESATMVLKSAAPIPCDEWVHVACMREEGRLELSFGDASCGVLDFKDARPARFASPNAHVCVGGAGNDEVEISGTRALVGCRIADVSWRQSAKAAEQRSWLAARLLRSPHEEDDVAGATAAPWSNDFLFEPKAGRTHQSTVQLLSLLTALSRSANGCAVLRQPRWLRVLLRLLLRSSRSTVVQQVCFQILDAVLPSTTAALCCDALGVPTTQELPIDARLLDAEMSTATSCTTTCPLIAFLLRLAGSAMWPAPRDTLTGNGSTAEEVPFLIRCLSTHIPPHSSLALRSEFTCTTAMSSSIVSLLRQLAASPRWAASVGSTLSASLSQLRGCLSFIESNSARPQGAAALRLQTHDMLWRGIAAVAVLGGHSEAMYVGSRVTTRAGAIGTIVSFSRRCTARVVMSSPGSSLPQVCTVRGTSETSLSNPFIAPSSSAPPPPSMKATSADVVEINVADLVQLTRVPPPRIRLGSGSKAAEEEHAQSSDAAPASLAMDAVVPLIRFILEAEAKSAVESQGIATSTSPPRLERYEKDAVLTIGSSVLDVSSLLRVQCFSRCMKMVASMLEQPRWGSIFVESGLAALLFDAASRIIPPQVYSNQSRRDVEDQILQQRVRFAHLASQAGASAPSSMKSSPSAKPSSSSKSTARAIADSAEDGVVSSDDDALFTPTTAAVDGHPAATAKESVASKVDGDGGELSAPPPAEHLLICPNAMEMPLLPALAQRNHGGGGNGVSNDNASGVVEAQHMIAQLRHLGMQIERRYFDADGDVGSNVNPYGTEDDEYAGMELHMSTIGQLLSFDGDGEGREAANAQLSRLYMMGDVGDGGGIGGERIDWDDDADAGPIPDRFDLGESSVAADPQLVHDLMDMGFAEQWCVYALQAHENDLMAASTWIVDNLPALQQSSYIDPLSLDGGRDESDDVDDDDDEEEEEDDDVEDQMRTASRINQSAGDEDDDTPGSDEEDETREDGVYVASSGAATVESGTSSSSAIESSANAMSAGSCNSSSSSSSVLDALWAEVQPSTTAAADPYFQHFLLGLPARGASSSGDEGGRSAPVRAASLPGVSQQQQRRQMWDGAAQQAGSTSVVHSVAAGHRDGERGGVDYGVLSNPFGIDDMLRYDMSEEGYAERYEDESFGQLHGQAHAQARHGGNASATISTATLLGNLGLQAYTETFQLEGYRDIRSLGGMTSGRLQAELSMEHNDAVLLSDWLHDHWEQLVNAQISQRANTPPGGQREGRFATVQRHRRLLNAAVGQQALFLRRGVLVYVASLPPPSLATMLVRERTCATLFARTAVVQMLSAPNAAAIGHVARVAGMEIQRVLRITKLLAFREESSADDAEFGDGGLEGGWFSRISSGVPSPIYDNDGLPSIPALRKLCFHNPSEQGCAKSSWVGTGSGAGSGASSAGNVAATRRAQSQSNTSSSRWDLRVPIRPRQVCPPVWDLITELVAAADGTKSTQLEQAHAVAAHFIGDLVRIAQLQQHAGGDGGEAKIGRDVDGHQSVALSEWVIRALAASGTHDSSFSEGIGPDAVASPQAFAALCSCFQSTSVHLKAVVCRIIAWIIRRWRRKARLANATPSLADAKARLASLPLHRIESLVHRRLLRESTSVASKAPLCFSAYVRALAAVAIEARRFMRNASPDVEGSRSVAASRGSSTGSDSSSAVPLAPPSAPVLEEVGQDSLMLSWFNAGEEKSSAETTMEAPVAYTVEICECSSAGSAMRAQAAGPDDAVNQADALRALADHTFDVVYDGAEMYCKVETLASKSVYACRVRSTSASGATSAWSDISFATVGGRVPFGFDPVRCGPNIALESLDPIDAAADTFALGLPAAAAMRAGASGRGSGAPSETRSIAAASTQGGVDAAGNTADADVLDAPFDAALAASSEHRSPGAALSSPGLGGRERTRRATMLKASYSGSESWSIVLAAQGFVTGRNSWAVRIEESSTAYLFVGVAAAAVDREGFLGGDEHGWGLIGDGALYHRRAKARSYGHKFGEGDVVGVTLDMDIGTLSFSRNGVNLGVAFVGIRGKLFPAVAFYSRDQRATLTFVDGLTQCLCPGLGISVAGTSPSQPTVHQLVDAATLSESMASSSSSARGSSSSSSNSSGDGEIAMTNDRIEQPLPSSVLRPAYESHAAWLAGHAWRCTTAARLDMELDVSPEACTVFGGFMPGDVITSSALYHSADESDLDDAQVIAAQAEAATADLSSNAHAVAGASASASGGDVSGVAAASAAADSDSTAASSIGGGGDGKAKARTAVATVLGVADNRLWVRWHGDEESDSDSSVTSPPAVIPRSDAWFISPQHLRKYPHDLKLVRRASQSPKAVPPHLECTHSEFAALVAPAYGWSVGLDTAIVHALNELSVTLRCSPFNITCKDALAACLPAVNSALASDAAQSATPLSLTTLNERGVAVLARISFLKLWNDAACRLLPFCDLSVGYVSQHEALRTALARLARMARGGGANPERCAVPGWGADSLDLNAVLLRGTIFSSTKEALLKRALERSATKTRKASDEYDYPDDLPQLQLNRHKSATAIALNVRSKLAVGAGGEAAHGDASSRGGIDAAAALANASHAALGSGMSLFEGAREVRRGAERSDRARSDGDTSGTLARERPGLMQLELAPIAHLRDITGAQANGEAKLGGGGSSALSSAVWEDTAASASLEDELRLAQSLFGQIFEELHYADPCTLRLGTPPSPLSLPLSRACALPLAPIDLH